MKIKKKMMIKIMKIKKKMMKMKMKQKMMKMKMKIMKKMKIKMRIMKNKKMNIRQMVKKEKLKPNYFLINNDDIIQSGKSHSQKTSRFCPCIMERK